MTDTSQLTHIEKRIDELATSTKHALEKTDSKIELLLDLARQMAVFQSKQDQHAEKIQKLEAVIAELKHDVLSELHKIDEKFLDLDKDKKTAIDRVHTRIDELNHSIEAEIKESDTTHKVLDKNTTGIHAEMIARIAFVKGVMWVLGMVLVVAQGIAIKTYNDIQKSIDGNASEVVSINKRLNEMDRQFDAIVNSINQIKDYKK